MFPLSLFAIVSGEDSVLVCVLSQQSGLSCPPPSLSWSLLLSFLQRIVSLFMSSHYKAGCSPLSLCVIVPAEDCVLVCVLSLQGGLSCPP